MTEKLLNQNAAAQFLGLSPITLEVWRSRGDGPRFVRLSRRAIRYQFSEIMKFVKAHEVEPKKSAARISRGA